MANMLEDESLELGRWFLRGQKAGQPIFSGLCAMCGNLLHGGIGQRSALSNKRAGPPCNRDGKILKNPDGSPMTDAQPPFLLRFSPSFFAQEAPEVFCFDAKTNRLSLRSGAPKPWLRPIGGNEPSDDTCTWLY